MFQIQPIEVASPCACPCNSVALNSNPEHSGLKKGDKGWIVTNVVRREWENIRAAKRGRPKRTEKLKRKLQKEILSKAVPDKKVISTSIFWKYFPNLKTNFIHVSDVKKGKRPYLATVLLWSWWSTRSALDWMCWGSIPVKRQIFSSWKFLCGLTYRKMSFYYPSSHRQSMEVSILLVMLLYDLLDGITIIC